MRKLRCLPTAVFVMALALPQLAMGQDVLVESDATYHYLLTIADINGSGMAVDPTAVDPSFAVVNLPPDANSQISNIALWPFPNLRSRGREQLRRWPSSWHGRRRMYCSGGKPKGHSSTAVSRELGRDRTDRLRLRTSWLTRG